MTRRAESKTRALAKTVRPCNRLITGGPRESTEDPRDLYLSVCRELRSRREDIPVLNLILSETPDVLEQFAVVNTENQELRSVHPTSGLVRDFQQAMQGLLRFTRQLPEIAEGIESNRERSWLATLNDFLQAAFQHLPVENRVGVLPDRNGKSIDLVAYPRIKGLNQLCVANYITYVISHPRPAEKISDCLYCGMPFISPRPNTLYCCTQCRDAKNSSDSMLRRALRDAS